MLISINPLMPQYLAARSKGLLPQADVRACRDVDDIIKCFKAGKVRVNSSILKQPI